MLAVAEFAREERGLVLVTGLQARPQSSIVTSVLFASLLLFALLLNADNAPSTLQAAANRCLRPLPQSDTLYYEDITVKGYASPSQLEAIGRSIYFGDRRHPGAFYYSAQRKSFIGRSNGELEIRVPAAFIEKVLSHLSAGLTRDYARSLYLADWGHGHFFIPMDEYHRKVEPLPGSFSQQLYDVLLNSEHLMVIYHSAEHMQKVVDGRTVEDPVSRHYIDRRNILGSFTARPETSYLSPEEKNPHNSQSRLNGYRLYGGIEFTWNKDACFPVQVGRRIVYVDLSFESPARRQQPTESDQ